jgi:hypothetical protein
MSVDGTYLFLSNLSKTLSVLDDKQLNSVKNGSFSSSFFRDVKNVV